MYIYIYTYKTFINFFVYFESFICFKFFFIEICYKVVNQLIIFLIIWINYEFLLFAILILDLISYLKFRNKLNSLTLMEYINT